MYFDLSDYQFPFFSLISASISKQITRNHFGLNFEADSDRTVFRVLPKNQIVDAGCDMKDAECLDENQVFVQLRSDVRNSKDSDPSVAAHPRWRRRRRFTRFHPFHPYHPYGPTSTTASGDTTSTTTGMVFPVCTLISATKQTSTQVLSAGAITTEKVRFRGLQFRGCCVEDIDSSLSLLVNFNSSRAGDLNVSLEPPNLQSQPLGVVPGTDFQFNFSGNIFKGVEASGAWDVIFLASPAAIGWSSDPLVIQLELKLDQCV